MAGWNVVSIGTPNGATPSSAAPPAAPPAPPPDPWAVTSVGGAPPQQNTIGPYQPTGMERALTWLRDPTNKSAAFPSGAGHAVAGAIADTGEFAGNILSWINKAARQAPVIADVKDAQGAPPAQGASQHVQEVADWLRSGGEPVGFDETVGALGAEAAQWFGPREILKLAGWGMDAVKAGVGLATGAGKAAQTVDAGEHLKTAADALNMLKKNPKMAGYMAIGIKAAKDALAQAAFQYAHNENATDAVTAGVGGGILSGAMHLAEPLAQGAMERFGTKSVPIEGVEGGRVTVSPQQLDEAGNLTNMGAANPKIAQQQQQKFGQFETSMAKKATRQVFNTVNETRPAPEAIAAAKQAGDDFEQAYAERTGTPAPQARPFSFTLEPPPSEQYVPGTSTVTGQPEDVRIVKEPGEGTKAVPAEGYEGPPEASHATTYPPATTERPEGGVVGTGTPTTEDPNEAMQWLVNYENARNDPGFHNLPEADQARIDSTIKNIRDQMSLYHTANPNARFNPIDTENLVAQVNSPHAASVLMDAQSQPVYDAINQASKGEFYGWREAEKKAQDVLGRSTTLESRASAEAALGEARSKMNDLLDRHQGTVNQTDYRTAKYMQRGRFLMDDLDTFTKSLANGVTPETTAKAGLQRFIAGDHQAFDRWLGNGTNLRDLTGMIGEEGVNNYRQMMTLLDNPQTARKANSVLKNIVTMQNFHPKILGVPTWPIAVMLGWEHPYVMGAAAGIGGVGLGMKKLMQVAADNPKFGNMLLRAVSQDIAPKYYAPLMARTAMELIGQPAKSGAERDKEEQQEAQPQP